ncbi:MAG: GntR family transcriptional regulator [Victivallaceae bacterium]|nr:GntR family transcriptional regulator [Victivallaceae bacterium]
MESLVILSKKEQIATLLEKQILTGAIVPGTKLSSIRALAAKFSVSTMIIIEAFDILENKRLIRRKHGNGVFVRSKIADDVIDVCLMCYDLFKTKNNYFASLARIAMPPFLREKFGFVIRIVPGSAGITEKQFEYEIKKVEQHLHVDCLLINAPTLNKKQIAICMKLRTPIIFIGDFSAGLYPELPYNQIAGDNSWTGQETVRQVVELKNYRKLTLYSGSMDHYFYRKFYDGALNEARRLGVDLHLVEFPKGITSSIAIAEREKIYRDKIAEAKANGWCSCPAICGGFLEKMMFKTFINYDVNVPFYCSKECEKSFEQLFETIYARIESVVENPQDYKKIRLKPKINVVGMPMAETIDRI